MMDTTVRKDKLGKLHVHQEQEMRTTQPEMILLNAFMKMMDSSTSTLEQLVLTMVTFSRDTKKEIGPMNYLEVLVKELLVKLALFHQEEVSGVLSDLIVSPKDKQFLHLPELISTTMDKFQKELLVIKDSTV